MHIIYNLVNLSNKSKGLKPYKYIGSKTNCEIVDNAIFCKKHKRKYWSSSKSVKESVKKGDQWILKSWFEVDDITKIYQLEGELQDSVSAKDNDDYYNKSHANLKFNSRAKETRIAISKSKKGKVLPFMKKKEYWGRLQKPEIRKINSIACTNNPNVVNAARKRSARLAKDPEFVKWRAELTSRTFKGRKITEHEMWLRHHDDRYKTKRKMTNKQVWEIRFGLHKDLSLNELLKVYTNVSKATLSRVKCFKVFKDITEEWNDGNEKSGC